MNNFLKFIGAVCLLILITTADLWAGEIHDAAAAGDLNKVRALIEADSTLLESQDGDGNTPLISACWGPPANIPHAAIANYLIDKGANVNARNRNGGSPLYFAHRSFDLMQRLIAKGADINVRAYGDLTPLHQAVSSGNLKTVKLLIDHGAALNARSQEGTILHRLINKRSKSNEELAKLLIESGAKLQEFSFGNTELHLAAMNGCADLVPLLIKHGADVNAVNEYNHTALYYAAKHGYRKTAEALIAAGAKKSDIVETNYGKAPQLSETLSEDEAYLWYLGGGSPCDGYAVKTKEHLLIFNPSGIDESLEAGLANGYLNPNELAGQKITVLIDHRSGDRYAPSVPELAKALPGADFVLNFKPTVGNEGNSEIPPYRLATPNKSFSIDGIQVHAISAMLKVFFDNESLGYLVEADGVKIFHAGLHVSSNENSQMEKYRKEIDFLKPLRPIDIAILPIRGHHIYFDYEPYLYLIDQLSPKAIYLIGDDLAAEEHRKCLEVLRVRNIPLAYPEGGIAVSERFHYLRD
jgi:ankyrin repeat protein